MLFKRSFNELLLKSVNLITLCTIKVKLSHYFTRIWLTMQYIFCKYRYSAAVSLQQLIGSHNRSGSF
jgi:hypothetical protein